MEEYYRKLLESCDEDGCYEFPSDFNGKDLEQRARKVFDGLQSSISECKFEDWAHNQDASFGLAIILESFSKNVKPNMITVPVIRFSNFGNLATITMTDHLPNDLSALIIGLFKENGFHYIPADVADTEYNGAMKGDSNFPTWWVRYFDWI
ncbi:hypothetical protein [Zooshikella ganghwensis]|uniref:hypothetical protein n=1 Tax=Zooshikella ganghwensis TaxID=202772 RepID=UPI0004850AA2|nr:hypothetical protein [Zooshikella ganghwensis]